MTANIISVEALGRSFSLGMLYDGCSDSIIHGVTMWNRETLEKHTTSSEDISRTLYEVIYSDTCNSSADSLNVNPELKLSVLAGLVNVSGSGKYIKSAKNDSKASKVIIKFESRSRYETLNINHIESDKSDIIFLDQATHIVVGIEYGCDVYFIFEENKNSESISTDKSTSLKTKMNAIIVSVKAGVKIDKNAEILSEINSINCEFIGDIELESIPTNLSQAIDVINILPKLVKQCPKTIHLFPIYPEIDKNAKRFLKCVDLELINSVTTQLEKYERIEMDVKNLNKTKDSIDIPFLRTEINDFQNMIYEVKQLFLDGLKSLIVKIRGGEEDHNELKKYLKNWEVCRGSPKNITDCINGIKVTINFLVKNVVKRAKCSKIDCQFEFSAESCENDNSFYFNLDSKLFSSKKLALIRKDPKVKANSTEEWFTPGNKALLMRTFEQFIGYKSRNKNLKFILTCIDKGISLVSIEHTQSFCTKLIKLPSAPGKPICEAGPENSILIQWKTPDEGLHLIERYLIIFKAQYDKNSKSFSTEMINTSNEKVSGEISGRSVFKQNYIFKICALSIAGQSESCDWSDCIYFSPSAVPEFKYKPPQRSKILTPHASSISPASETRKRCKKEYYDLVWRYSLNALLIQDEVMSDAALDGPVELFTNGEWIWQTAQWRKRDEDEDWQSILQRSDDNEGLTSVRLIFPESIADMCGQFGICNGDEENSISIMFKVENNLYNKESRVKLPLIVKLRLSFALSDGETDKPHLCNFKVEEMNCWSDFIAIPINEKWDHSKMPKITFKIVL